MTRMTDDERKGGSTSELEGIRRELARGTAELAVLSLVGIRRRYGYELLRELQAPCTGILEIKEGTLYPLLHRLEDAGHMVGEWHAEDRARPRKYYSITPEGRERVKLLRDEWARLTRAVQGFLEATDQEER